MNAPHRQAHLQESLQAGLSALGLALSATQEAQLLDYMGLIEKWNKVYNLTALRAQESMLTHHVLDCLAIIPALRRWVAEQGAGFVPHILDVGAGAGLPSLVIAICQPEWQVDAIDTVGKKTAFMQQAAASLGLARVRVHHGRVEALHAPQAYSLITSRAFSALDEFVHLTAHLLASHGCWMAMKGKAPSAEEEEQLQKSSLAKILRVEPVQVPQLPAERCLVWMQPKPLP